MSKTIDLGVLMLALITEGQDNSERYGFKVGDIIKFSPSEIQIIADKYAKEQSTIKQPHWIPCDEKLPRKERVLITMRDGCVTIGRQFDKNDWSTHEGKYNARDFDVVAWMPLPEPYRGESDE